MKVKRTCFDKNICNSNKLFNKKRNVRCKKKGGMLVVSRASTGAQGLTSARG